MNYYHKASLLPIAFLVLFSVAFVIVAVRQDQMSPVQTITSVLPQPHSQLAQLADVTSGLVDWWKFDEGSGTAVSDSIGTASGILAGGTLPVWTTGKNGRALSFNGTTGHVTIGGVTMTAPFTVSMWLNANNDTGTKALIADASTNHEILFINGNAIKFYWNAFETGIYSLPTGSWYHYVAVVDPSGNGTQYINGAVAGTFGPISSSGTFVAIGGEPGGNGFNGSMDDVRIYNRNLSATEISQLYAFENSGSGSTVLTPPPPPAQPPTPIVGNSTCGTSLPHHCWYIDNSLPASGTHDGTTWSTAWKTIGDMNVIGGGQIQPGDFVYISGGDTSQTYALPQEFQNLPPHYWSPNISGTAGSPVTFKVGQDAHHNGTVIFDGQNEAGSNAIDPERCGIGNQNNYLTFDGDYQGQRHFLFTRLGNAAANISGCIGITIRYSSMDDAGIYGNGSVNTELDHDSLVFVATNGKIQKIVLGSASVHDNYIQTVRGPQGGADAMNLAGGSRIYNNTVFAAWDPNYLNTDHQDGIQMWASDVKIYNNLFYNLENSCIFYATYPGSTDISDVYIYNNVCVHSWESIAIGNNMVGTLHVTKSVVANNTVVDGTGGFDFRQCAPENNTCPGQSAPSRVTIYDPSDIFSNNILYNSGSFNFADTFTHVDNSTHSSNVAITEPNNTHFVSYVPGTATMTSTQDNLQLLPGDNDLIGQGTNLSSYFTTDMTGAARPTTAPWDIGAYQYSTLPPPTNVTPPPPIITAPPPTSPTLGSAPTAPPPTGGGATTGATSGTTGGSPSGPGTSGGGAASGLNGGSLPGSGASATSTCTSLPSAIPASALNLTIGTRGVAVVNLQTFLVITGYLDQRYITGYYGNLTKAALASYQAAHSTSSCNTQTPSVQTISNIPMFTRSLTIGSSGIDIKYLQIFLNGHGFLVASSGNGSKGHETAYFGPATMKALTAFQRANGITPAYGYFGQLTRTKVNQLLKQ